MDIDNILGIQSSGKNSRDRVYKTIRDNILYMNFLPGSVINEAAIAQMLQVSRTPVREAFVRLSRDNLIVTYPQRGSYITKIDMRLVEEGIFMRKCLEKAVCREAARNATPKLLHDLSRYLSVQRDITSEDDDFAVQFVQCDNRFHQCIFDSQGKGNIWDSILALCTHFNRLRYLETRQKKNLSKVLVQHESMIEAIAANDTDKIDMLIDHHMGNIKSVVIQLQEEHPEQIILAE